MANVLVIDESAFWRDLAADGLRLKGHAVTTAPDCAAGQARLSKGPVDLILLDVQLSGLSGFDFLDQLRRLPQHKTLPIIILTSEMQKEQVVRARQLGVMDYLLKTRFSLAELIDRVERRLEKPPVLLAGRPAIESPSASGLPNAVNPSVAVRPLLTRDQCLERALKALGARTLSGVVSKVIASASSPRTHMSELASLVGRDPMLSARVVAAANRLENASDRRVISNLMDAVRVIGSATIREIASSFWVYDAMPAAEPDGYNPIRCWQHSIAVARLCELLAPEEHRPVAYLLGLCHDLGEILFRSHFSAEYRQVLEMERQTAAPRSELETQMLGLTHGELVQCILKQLALPDTILQPIAAFHAALAHGALPSTPAARLLSIADSFSTGLMLNSSDQTGVRPLGRTEFRAATGVDEPPQINWGLFRAEVGALTAECARLSSREQSDLFPLVPVRRFVKVWLARDPSFSSFDPVATALDPMVDLSIHNRLPGSAELSGYHAVIVLVRNANAHGFTPDDVQQSLERSAPGMHAVLYLSAKASPASDRASISFATWPIPISRLAVFVGGLT